MLAFFVLALAVLGAQAGISPAAPQDPEKTEAVLRNSIDDAFANGRDIILNGSPELGIPVLDPFKLEHQDVNIEQEGLVSLHGSLDDVESTGLGAFVVDASSIKISIIPARATVTVAATLPDLKLSGEYDLTGSVQDVNAFGKGPFSAEVEGAAFRAVVVINIGFKLTVRSVDVTLSLDSVNSDVHGILGDEALSQQINDAINNQAVDLFNANKATLEAQLAEIVKTVVQNAL